MLHGDYEDAFYLLGEGSGSPVEVERVQGCVVFLGDASLLSTTQVNELQNELCTLPGGSHGVAWVEGARRVVGARRRVHTLPFDAAGRTGGELSFNFGGHKLRLPPGCLITRSVDGNSLVITCDRSSGQTMSFGPASSSERFALPEQRVELRVGNSPEAGSLSFVGALPGNSFEPWIRFFFPKSSPVIGGGQVEIGGFRYPVFAGGGGDGIISFRASFNPARPFDSTLNSLVLKSGATFTTNFLSPVGRVITLTSVAGNSGFMDQWDPSLNAAYTVLSGEWQLGLATVPDSATGDAFIDLMVGLSGVEYGKVPNQSYMSFVPGGPSFAPFFLGATATASAPFPLTSQCSGSEYPVTTSWVYLLDQVPGPVGVSETAAQHSAATSPAEPFGYYSQPETASLFKPDVSDELLSVLELRAASFPPGATGVFGAPQAGFPAAPYAGVQPSGDGGVGAESAALYKRFETEILSTARSKAISQLNANAGGPPRLAASGHGPSGIIGSTVPTPGPTLSAVTPQGLLSTFSSDYAVWESLLLAITQGEGGAQTLSLANIRGQLQSALLTNQLFLVVSAFDLLENFCDLEFGQLVINGWTFDLSSPESLKGTIMIIKFAERDLESLISDLSLWTMPASFSSDPQVTQTTLLQLVADAKANLAGEPDLSYFVNTVLAGSQSLGGANSWNGILFLNCKVPPSEFPPELRGLAAGIDADKLRAHHLGVNLAPFQVEAGQVTVTDSSIFGLILYDSPTDLVYQNNPYDYKVLSLHVLFANSEVTGFSSSVELLVAELFGEKATLTGGEHGNNIILNGVMQKHDDKDSFTFTAAGSNVFAIDSLVLDRVIISRRSSSRSSPTEARRPAASSTHASSSGARYSSRGSTRSTSSRSGRPPPRRTRTPTASATRTFTSRCLFRSQPPRPRRRASPSWRERRSLTCRRATRAMAVCTDASRCNSPEWCRATRRSCRLNSLHLRRFAASARLARHALVRTGDESEPRRAGEPRGQDRVLRDGARLHGRRARTRPTRPSA